MSPHAYTEDQLVERPAIGLFATLGWQTVSALEETFGAGQFKGSSGKCGMNADTRMGTALDG